MPFNAGKTPETIHDDGEYVTVCYKPSDPPGVMVVTTSINSDLSAASNAFEHAYSFREELDRGWAAIPLQIMREEGKTSLILEDPGGELLAQNLEGAWEYGPFLKAAVGLANSLKHFHGRNLIHRNLAPGNILVDIDRGEVRLSGFFIASRFPGYRQEAEVPSKVVGFLAYMAPEQTGRMNRSIDSTLAELREVCIVEKYPSRNE